MCAKSAATSCVREKRCYDSARLPVLRCTRCRLLVDAGSSSARRCAACDGPLERGLADPTIWDDDPTERRPADYAEQLSKRHKR